MNQDELKKLEQSIEEITGIAQRMGLDFYPMRYEICPADIIYTFGAYGMPTRFSHWSFGKSFHRMKLQYDLGLSKIYELVINSNPCYAFLLEGNSLIQNKMIVAHVLAHCDFFKNNARFSRTNRDMVERMASSADRIRAYEFEHGALAVEQFLDAALGIQEHVDPGLFKKPRRREDVDFGEGKGHGDARGRRKKKERRRLWGYEDLWDLDEADRGEEEDVEKKFPASPEKDLVGFLQAHSPILDDWQRDILTMLRDEMLYFWPQIETKIMNEGWASYCKGASL